MQEGVKKFADPQKALLALIDEQRKTLAAVGPDARSGQAERARR